MTGAPWWYIPVVPPGPQSVALVLAGGGARGAYEAGAMSVLLPALEPQDRPRILIGTSVGAINTAYVAANAHKSPADVADGGLAMWRSIRYGQVLKPLISGSEAARVLAYLGEVAGIPRVEATSLLDPSPLAAELPVRIKFGQIRENVRGGVLDAAAVVATSAQTSTSVVFHDGGPDPAADQRRGIEYVSTELTPDHVRASAAIPVLFPAVQVGDGSGRHWYFDGGTRLNTPIKPALALGADGVIVIALNSLAPRLPHEPEPRPDALDGATQILQAVLVDPLANDVQTLAMVNDMLADATPAKMAANEQRTGKRQVRYMLIAPEDPEEIGRIATDVYREHYGRPHDLLRSFNLAGLGHLVSAGRNANHGELLSYLFFAPEFAERLIELGRRDAQRWLEQAHNEGQWQLERLG
jgi:NTE family protein